jgi:hypothetical protein
MISRFPGGVHPLLRDFEKVGGENSRIEGEGTVRAFGVPWSKGKPTVPAEMRRVPMQRSARPLRTCFKAFALSGRASFAILLCLSCCFLDCDVFWLVENLRKCGGGCLKSALENVVFIF